MSYSWKLAKSYPGPYDFQSPCCLPLCYTAKLQNTYFPFQGQNLQSFNTDDPSYILEVTFLMYFALDINN